MKRAKIKQLKLAILKLDFKAWKRSNLYLNDDLVSKCSTILPLENWNIHRIVFFLSHDILHLYNSLPLFYVEKLTKVAHNITFSNVTPFVNISVGVSSAEFLKEKSVAIKRVEKTEDI
ncbi:hypothetical protein SADUNF_Sadunf17G0042400 [Salix dunnii]|uniref:Uncharacterized protein n=1 Tax=Salix dunnii TaxID=1413687 RepID=A0A835MEE0_9ROSI|nr:hypothetical protein SADUNF_Sadunf17G0042400 [Salix dunnii]